MKAGWWQVSFQVKVGYVLCDISDLPKDTIAGIINQIGQGAVAGSFELPDDYRFPECGEEDKENV